MVDFVLGFPFVDKSHVLLIEKTHPPFMAGLLNGIGGKVENGETPEGAMRREGLEEAGIDPDETRRSWMVRGVLNFYRDDTPEFNVYVLAMYGLRPEHYRQKTSEKLVLVDDFHDPRCLGDLHWLLPLCMDERLRDYGSGPAPFEIQLELF